MNSPTRKLAAQGSRWATRTLRYTKMVPYSTQTEKDAYLEEAKKQLREYDNWRQHFRWPQGMVRQVLRDYSLWSVLALLAYYNLNKRQEREEYDAETFVAIDKLQEKIYKRDPNSRMLRGTIWENKREEEEGLRKALEDSYKHGNSTESDGRRGGTAVVF